jgi:hypothetical protein
MLYHRTKILRSADSLMVDPVRLRRKDVRYPGRLLSERSSCIATFPHAMFRAKA